MKKGLVVPIIILLHEEKTLVCLFVFVKPIATVLGQLAALVPQQNSTTQRAEG